VVYNGDKGGYILCDTPESKCKSYKLQQDINKYLEPFSKKIDAAFNNLNYPKHRSHTYNAIVIQHGVVRWG
jgi:hypothetical protein